HVHECVSADIGDVVPPARYKMSTNRVRLRPRRCDGAIYSPRLACCRDPRLPYLHRDPWVPRADGPQRWTLTPARPMIWTGGIDCTTCRRRRNGRLNKGTEHSMTEWRTSEADVAAILAARHPDSFTSTAVGRNEQIVAAPNSVGPVESTRSRQ